MYKVRRMGCNSTHNYNFSVDRPNGYDCYLLLLIKTPALALIENQQINIAPGTILLYPPGVPHRYHSIDNHYINDWIQFELSSGSTIDYRIPVNTPILLKNYSIIEPFFELINSEFFSSFPMREIVISNLINVLLTKLSALTTYQESNCVNEYTEKLIQIRQNIYSFPERSWQIEDLANSLALSQGHFHLLYKNTFGTTCHNDVIQSRLEHAQELLASTQNTIQEISELCGYSSKEHFTRQFRSHMQMTPSQYRKKHFKIEGFYSKFS